MRFRISTAILLWWCIARHLCLSASESSINTSEDTLNFWRVANTRLLPVYAPLAEHIVTEYNLAEKKGIGIDLGSGPGNLIIELCKKTQRMQWINADINPNFFPLFLKEAEEAGVGHRVSAVHADAQVLPFENDYAEIIVSRGSFQFWDDKKLAFSEIYRVLKPGGIAFIGRGFSENLPVEIARKIRNQGKGPKYDVAKTANELQEIMQVLEINDYRILIPKPPGSEGVNYGIWLEFRKPVTKKHRLNNLKKEASKNSYREKNVYLYASDNTVVRDTRSHDVIAEPMLV